MPLRSILENETGETNEVVPPWIEFPGFPPSDTFWRQSGEYWFALVWEPYWKSLNPQEQQDYLEKWNVPEVWRNFYFDPEFQAWLDSTDE
jgi:hypothetical protein